MTTESTQDHQQKLLDLINSDDYRAKANVIPQSFMFTRNMPTTEWGTDCWGEILSEPTEEQARRLAKFAGRNVYSRPPMGQWAKEDSDG